ncbi:MAG: hypothetical protein RL208_768 [Pseudomonadota bacterium]
MKKKILIVAKTYPCPSRKYGELVCTAGVDENGKWYRLYPIQFRNLNKQYRYRKYQWIEVEIEKDKSDPRIESYKIIGNITPLEIINTSKSWYLRCKLLLQHIIYTSKKELIYDCRESVKQISLAIFKPMKIINFYIENVVDNKRSCETYQLPFKFYYKFQDSNGKISKLQIIDWEIGELTRKLLIYYSENYTLIKDILKYKYFTAMQKRNIYFSWHKS